MRGLRSTIALLVVLIGLGAYIYFVTWKRAAQDSGSKLEKVFASVLADQIEELKVKAESGDVTTLKKTSGAWAVVAPMATTASETEASSITSALSALEIERVVDENPADVKDYGLETPRIEIDFKTSGGQTSGRLLVGAKTPTGASMYARRNDEKRVFLVAEHQNSSLNKSTFDFRDKSIIEIEREKVDGVEVAVSAAPQLQFAKAGNEWTLTKPLEARADSGLVEALVGSVETAQMKSVAADSATPADLKKYGLERPEVTITVHLGSARATLALGGKAGPDTVYARDTSKPVVVTVDSTLADTARKGADDYRRKDVFEFRAFNATRAEFTRNGQTMVLERVKGKSEADPDGWRRVSPNPADADRSKVEGLLAGLADTRATAFTPSIAKTGLDAPALTVLVKFEDGKREERVSFGTSGTDVFALVAGQPGAAKVEAEKFADANKTLDELLK
jgi:hypothetical protein